jgi:hypothetical protein
MRAANILTGIVWALWASFVWIGIGLTKGVVAQHVLGFPSSGQITYYICVPLVVATTLLLSAIVLNFARRLPIIPPIIPPIALAVLAGVAFMFLPLYIFGYGGGM